MKSVSKSACVVAAIVALTFVGGAARAELLISVDQSKQRMTVAVDGAQLYEWPVSTGRPGYETPGGVFKPNRMVIDHYSDEYDQAPMPHAIFFDLKGHAIHGTFEPIGRPAASRGCVRLEPANAAKLFALVKQQKMANTKVEITGDVMVALRNHKSTQTAKNTARRRSDSGFYAEADIVVPPAMERVYRGRSSQEAVYGFY
jgi:hypothetical protein